MPRTCTVCNHPERATIDAALAAGDSCSTLSERYSTIGRMAFERHKANHLPATVVKAQEQAEIERAGELLTTANDHADELLKQAETLEKIAESILARTYQEGNYKTAIAGVNAARECLRLRAELVGKLKNNPSVNVLINPQWVMLRAMILRALDSYPDARQAVVEALNADHPSQ